MSKRACVRIVLLIALAHALLFMLPACTSTRYIEKPVYIDIPVTEACIKSIPEEPIYETRYLQESDPIGVVAQAYRIERKQREAYIETLRAELVGCVEPK